MRPSATVSRTSPGTWTSGLATQNRPTSSPMANPASAFVRAWTPISPPPATSWRKPAKKPDDAADLGPPAQGHEHGQDQRHVRRDAPDAQGRHHARLRDAAADRAQEEQEPHAYPSTLNRAAMSWVVWPVSSSTSSTRGKSAAGATTAK